MKHARILAGSCGALLLATAVAHADERRGFYFDAGLGFGGASYGSEVDDALDAAEDSGLNRIALSLDLSVGGAVLQNLYLVGSLSGFADRLYKSSEYLQVNTYLIGAGVRYYPLSSRKHLLLGADVGLAKLVLQTSAGAYDDATSDAGTGLRLLVAYDIDSTLRGPTLQIGAQFMSASIEDVKFNGFSVFAKFAFK